MFQKTERETKAEDTKGKVKSGTAPEGRYLHNKSRREEGALREASGGLGRELPE